MTLAEGLLVANEGIPEEFGGIFNDDELAELQAYGNIGDTLNRAGFQILNPEQVEDMVQALAKRKQHFPFSLSLDGFNIPRPASWVQTSINDETSPVPGIPELVNNLPEEEWRNVQLNQRSYAHLDEAIAVGKAFPEHEFYDDLTNKYTTPDFEGKYSDRAFIMGLTLVRLLVTKETYPAVATHEQIQQENIYPIREDRLWGYDFVRASKGDEPLMLFVPEKRVRVPALNRQAFEQLWLETYYKKPDQLNEYAQSAARRRPRRLLAQLQQNPQVATNHELRLANMLIDEAAAKARTEGASEAEALALRAELEQKLFGGESV